MLSCSGKPWMTAQIPAKVFNVHGMLGHEERACLYWLTRNPFTGRGLIVDAGAFIGASAFCMAAGLKDRDQASFSSPQIHSYGFFTAFDEYVAEDLSRNVRPTKLGESYIDIYL